MEKFIEACKTLKMYYHKKAYVNRRMIRHVIEGWELQQIYRK